MNVAGNLHEHIGDPRPGHICDIQQECETGKAAAATAGPDMDTRQELGVGDGVDDAG